MSEAFHIISDGSCDLPMEMTKEKDITVVPFYVSFEEGKYQKEMTDTRYAFRVLSPKGLW